jgi:hypothetical protein
MGRRALVAGDRRVSDGPPVSHGICALCVDDELKRFRRERGEREWVATALAEEWRGR